jgi:hypothetical protein
MSASTLPDPLKSSQLAYAQDGAVRVAYAPFDHVATSARLVVVGITPGLSQANTALLAAQKHLAKGLPHEEVLRFAKLTASFSGGAMRSNLTTMLDAIGVNQLFDLKSTGQLFNPSAEHVHFTSALRYPVFVNGKNYNGTPDMLRTPILRALVDTYLAEEARLLPKALWLPLGPKAEVALHHLSSKGLLDRTHILSGLPHPSGANAERVAVFLGRKDPEMASSQTKPGPLLEAFKSLRRQIATLKGERN